MSQNSSDAKSLICAAISQNRLSHALFLAGDSYQCEELVAYACSELFEMTQSRVQFSPDFHTYDGSQMRVATVLELLEVLLNPPLKNKRVIQIKNAGFMPEDVQNKLLKTLEEPQVHNHFFLFGNEEGLLPTIRSRCMRINLGQLSVFAVAEYVERATDCSYEDALYYAKLSDCDIENAILLANEKEYLENYYSAVDLVCMIGKQSLISSKIDEFSNATLFFDVLYLCLCDMLYYYLGLELKTFTREPYSKQIIAVADRLTKTQVIKIFDICIEARKLMLERVPQKQALVFFATNTEQVV